MRLLADNILSRLRLLLTMGGLYSAREAAVLPFSLAAALLAWWLIAGSNREHTLAHVAESLQTINEFKITQAEGWIEEHSREATRLSRHPIFGGIVEQEMLSPGSRRAQLVTWLKEHLIQAQYVSLAFLSPSGAVVAATPGYAPSREASFLAAFRRCAASGRAELTDMYLSEGGKARLSMIIPMSRGGRPGAGTQGVLVIVIDPTVSLFPMLRPRQAFMGSVETSLLRRDGDRALLLNSTARSGYGPMTLSMPLDTPGLPAAAALRGYEGFMQGSDFWGTPVYASVGTEKTYGWAVVTMVSRAEVNSQLRVKDQLALALLLLAVTGVNLAFYLAVKMRYESGRMALGLSEAKFRETVDLAVDGILLGDSRGYIIGTNEQMCRIAGRGKKEMLGLHVRDFFDPEELRRKPLRFEDLKAGLAVTNERDLLRPDGTRVRVEMRSKVMPDGTYQSIYRDISERKAAERALAESERQLRAMFDSSRDALMQVEGPDWKFISGNSAMKQMFGAARVEDLLGRGPWEASPERQPDGSPSAEKARKLLQRALREGSVLFEWTHRRLDGAEFPAEVQLTRVDLPGRQVLLGNVRDITLRKAAENMLRESEEKFRQLIERAPVGVFMVQDGLIAYANPSLRDIFGYGHGDKVEGLRPQVMLAPEDLPKMEALTAERMLGIPQKENTVYTGLKKDGSRFLLELTSTRVDFRGRPALMGTVLDITERARAQRELAVSQQRLSSLWEHMAEGVALHEVVRGPDGEPGDYRLVDVNPQYGAILGMDAAAVRGRLGSEVYGVKPAPYLREFTMPLRTGKTYYLETYFPPMDKHFAISVAPWGKDGFATIFTDITARRKVELERERLNRDLELKTREMENFLYITTHDLRSPLVNIQGFSRNVERYAGELKQYLRPGEAEAEKIIAERIPEALRFVFESLEKMDSLIKALLKVSRAGRQELRPEKVDMNALFAKISDSNRYALDQKGGSIEVGRLPACRVDLAAADQIFSNLVDNALKYCSPDRPPRIEVKGEVRGSKAVYTVADNGCGISERDLPKIWEVFYRAGKVAGVKGEGIGLATVKRFVQNSGGGISAASEEGKGTVFTVELPLAGGA